MSAFVTVRPGWLAVSLVLLAALAHRVFRDERASGAKRATADLWVVVPLALVVGLVVLVYLILFAVMGATLEHL